MLQLWVADLHGSSLPAPSQISRLAGLLLASQQQPELRKPAKEKETKDPLPTSPVNDHTAAASDGKLDLQSKWKQSALLISDIGLIVHVYTASRAQCSRDPS